MSLAHHQLELPESLQTQLHQFRARVWKIKTIEAVCGAVFGILLAFLVTFALDRLFDTPAGLRLGIFVAAMVGCAMVPLALHRWVWRHRRLEQLARLLSRKHPSVGDQLLGIIELVHSETEQARSRTLCEAAVKQVAEVATKRDFSDSVPNPKHRRRAAFAGIALAIAVVLLGMFPSAATNAWARFLMPWKNTPRYTFAAIEPLPDKLVVAHGEPFNVAIKLAEKTEWRPTQGEVQLGGQQPVSARLNERKYDFELPAQIDAGQLKVSIGDLKQQVRVEPTLRPELNSVAAHIDLPEYLGRTKPVEKDVRGGTISLVKGSRATFVASASRELSAAQVDGQPHKPSGAKVTSPAIKVDESRKVEFQWQDQHGLAGKEPFTLSVNSREDEAPSISCEELPRQKVVLDSEVLNFKVKAQDDFGVKQVGIVWQGIDTTNFKNPAKGERILSAGGHEKEVLDLAGTFSAQSLGIEPQPINVRLFVEDYLPGRERVYSPTYMLYVLNAEQHAIWVTEMLSKWHRQSLEVRDREMQLHETNKQLRDLTPEELDQPDARKRIDTQATAERANGRRLSNLVLNGEDLVKQAMRNPEIGVGHLEKWAEMLQILKDISGNRMPSVADLLKQAAQAPQQVAANSASNKAPMAGQIRAANSGSKSGEQEGEKKKATAVPTIADVESSQQSANKKGDEQPPNKSKPKSPSLRLPVTTLMVSGSPKKNDSPPPADENVDEAVKEQQDLLAEFEKISDELNRVLANLEGSTLVKRLKAASRTQYKIAGRLSDQISDAFGQSVVVKEPQAKLFTELATQENKSSNDVSNIMDDLQSYFERRHFAQFKVVLDEMRKEDVIGALRQLGDDLKKENGLSIAQAEFWSDNLDRWAEDLVEAGCKGQCPGCKSKGSLPPSIVLEVLQILEGEVNLREETRVAEQARPAIEAAEHEKLSNQLAETQQKLGERVENVVDRIRALPDGETEFGKEIGLLMKVAEVMHDAMVILKKPDTGSPAIAAETEAIELLLQSKRINPKAGGGGGANPGGGGGGTTNDSALTLIGSGLNDKEVREDHGVSQSTGDSGPKLPEEFRNGLDEYFNRLEKSGGK